VDQEVVQCLMDLQQVEQVTLVDFLHQKVIMVEILLDIQLLQVVLMHQQVVVVEQVQ
jgi:hypothetical protein